MRHAKPMQAFFEQLEPRIVLDGSPFPTLAMLEDPSNAVVRIDTRFGAIDVELFGAGTGLTASAFRELVFRGSYSGTFFHDLQAGQTLGAGLYRFDDTAGLSQRTGALPVTAPTPRPNLERTLAMPVPVAGVNESRGEFIFNLADNSASLDDQWTVFGRVVQGWEVVQQIAGLDVFDLSQILTGPGAQELTSVPMLEANPQPLSTGLVFLDAVQQIKAAGVQAFFEHRIYYPEGYSWERIAQSLEVTNPHDQPVDYQVIVRYERGERDQVLMVRSLGANLRETLIISPDGEPSTLVRNNEPYAYEVWSTLPVAADLRHRDFGVPTRESFFNPAALPDRALMQAWTFNQAALGFGASNIFIVWQNTTGEAGQVTVTFYFADAPPEEVVFDLGAHRRGGLNLLDVQGLAKSEDYVGARVTSDVAIVASISRYDRRTDDPGSTEGGIMALGTFGGGSTVGMAPGARRGPAADAVTILNTTTEPITITFIVNSSRGGTAQMEVTAPPNRLLVLPSASSPSSLAQPGSDFAIHYSADAPVTVGFITSAFRGTGTAFATWAAEHIHFSDASVYTAPSGAPFGLQAVSIYNPGATASADSRLFFRFNQGPRVVTPAQGWIVPSQGTQDRRINSFAPLIAQTRQGLSDLTARAPYSLEVRAQLPIVAQMRQMVGAARAELGMPLSPITLLGNPMS